MRPHNETWRVSAPFDAIARCGPEALRRSKGKRTSRDSRQRDSRSIGGDWPTRSTRQAMHLPYAPGWHVRALQVFCMKPNDYPLYSSRSRAAARALLASRIAARKRIEVVSTIPRPGADGEIRIGGWIEGPDGTLFRSSSIPAGTTIEEAERIVAKPGWKPSPQPPRPEIIRPPLKPEW